MDPRVKRTITKLEQQKEKKTNEKKKIEQENGNIARLTRKLNKNYQKSMLILRSFTHSKVIKISFNLP